MATIKNVNNLNTVTLDNAKAVVVKDGKFATADVASALKTIEDKLLKTTEKIKTETSTQTSDLSSKVETAMETCKSLKTELENLKSILENVLNAKQETATLKEDGETTAPKTRKSKKSEN